VLRICSKLLEMRSAECGVWSEDRQAAAFCEPTVPQVLWEDRDNFLYAMTAAPQEHQTWKEMLLAGDLPASAAIATSCGRLLAQLHAATWGKVEIAARLDDRAYFDQLRLDPYYRHVGRVHPDLQPHIERLVDSVWQHRRCLVHGDFSPKNLLVWPGNVMLIDFEVGHYGDPAFDLGFFLTHLVLKGIWSDRRQQEYFNLATAFWTTYQKLLAAIIPADEVTALEGRALWNLAGCLLARVDGKSPVEYLSAEQRELVRSLARDWVVQPPPGFTAAIHSLGGPEMDA
jgi:5-methylthioribose kinase